MVQPSPLKRKSEFSEDEYGKIPLLISRRGDTMFFPTTRRELQTKPVSTPAKGKHEQNSKLLPEDFTNALTKLSLNHNYQQVSTYRDTDAEVGESTPSTARTTLVSGIEPEQSALAVAVYFNTPFQPFILVKPSFAAGAFAHCSIWLGLNDRKLYVRKLQVRSVGVPKDVTHYVEHAGVPKLVASLQHGKNPVRAAPMEPRFGALDTAIDIRKANLSKLSYWSTMTEFVNGPTLLSVFKNLAGKGYVFPEAGIWKCGSVLLEVIRKMRFPDSTAGDKHMEPVSHNDIYPRNILLANDNPNQTATTNFYLIDFGMATFQSESGHRNQDLYQVVDILCSMMLNQNLGQAAKAKVKRKKEEDGWPYSNELAMKMEEIEDVSSKAIPRGFPTKYWLDKWVGNFNHMAQRASSRFEKSGKSNQVPLRKPLTIKRPWLFRGVNAVEKMTSFMMEETGCDPYQHAWVEEGSLRLVKVEEGLYWNEPEVDVL